MIQIPDITAEHRPQQLFAEIIWNKTMSQLIQNRIPDIDITADFSKLLRLKRVKLSMKPKTKLGLVSWRITESPLRLKYTLK